VDHLPSSQSRHRKPIRFRRGVDVSCRVLTCRRPVGRWMLTYDSGMYVEQIPNVDLDGADGIAMASLNAGTLDERVKIDVASLQPGSSLPKHPAGREQVFYVISGHGRSAGDDDVERPISAGWAAVFARGEQHTSWADSAMTVLIIQRRPVID